jgi:hypothetical protein
MARRGQMKAAEAQICRMPGMQNLVELALGEPKRFRLGTQALQQGRPRTEVLQIHPDGAQLLQKRAMVGAKELLQRGE